MEFFYQQFCHTSLNTPRKLWHCRGVMSRIHVFVPRVCGCFVGVSPVLQNLSFSFTSSLALRSDRVMDDDGRLFCADGEVTIAASVATGLENVAATEIQEKILNKQGKGTVVARQGRVYLTSSKDNLASIHDLRSVDRLFLIVKTCKNYVYKESKEETLADLTKFANELDWSEVVKFWFYNRKYCKGRSRQEDLSKWPLNAKRQKLNEENVRVESSPSAELKSQSTEAEHILVQSNPQNGNNEVGNDDNCAGDGPAVPIVAPDGTLIRFRVSTNRVGKKQPITSPEASYQFGGEIQNITKWKVDLSNYNLEIMLCLGESSLEVAVALTLQSLHRRNITHFGVTTLRATTAYCMLRLCNVRAGDIVVDPMCGSGAIPVEGSLEWPKGYHIGGDITNASTTKCRENINFLNENPGFASKMAEMIVSRKSLPADTIRWDITDLPLRSSSVDVIVSDLPFGKRIGTKTDNRKLYPALLKELGRITRPESGRACLLTQDKRTIIRALDSLRELWKIKKTLYINIGGLTAGVFLLKRTVNVFQHTKQE